MIFSSLEFVYFHHVISSCFQCIQKCLILYVLYWFLFCLLISLVITSLYIVQYVCVYYLVHFHGWTFLSAFNRNHPAIGQATRITHVMNSTVCRCIVVNFVCINYANLVFHFLRISLGSQRERDWRFHLFSFFSSAVMLSFYLLKLKLNHLKRYKPKKNNSVGVVFFYQVQVQPNTGQPLRSGCCRRARLYVMQRGRHVARLWWLGCM